MWGVVWGVVWGVADAETDDGHSGVYSVRSGEENVDILRSACCNRMWVCRLLAIRVVEQYIIRYDNHIISPGTQHDD